MLIIMEQNSLLWKVFTISITGPKQLLLRHIIKNETISVFFTVYNVVSLLYITHS